MSTSAEAWKIASPKWPPYAVPILAGNGKALPDPVVTAVKSMLTEFGTCVTILQNHPVALAIAKSNGYQRRIKLVNGDFCDDRQKQTMCCLMDPPIANKNAAN